MLDALVHFPFGHFQIQQTRPKAVLCNSVDPYDPLTMRYTEGLVLAGHRFTSCARVDASWFVLWTVLN